jgi:hypothetical protein
METRPTLAQTILEVTLLALVSTRTRPNLDGPLEPQSSSQQPRCHQR